MALLGVLVAEVLEAVRICARGSGGFPNRWPPEINFRHYVETSAVRFLAAGVVALALFSLGMLCDETLAFLSGLSTLKIVEIFFGYAPGS